MELFTKQQKEKLVSNGKRQMEAQRNNEDYDPAPVVKIFTPDANATWLLTELDPNDDDLGFGLCDLGLGEPEIGYVSISELTGFRGRMGLPVERDLHFTADKSLSAYAEEAREKRRIVA